MQHPQQRAMLFIDGSNFYHKLKFLIGDRRDQYRLGDFQYKEFADYFARPSMVTDVRYYVGAVRRQNGVNQEKAEKMYRNQQRLLAAFQQQNVSVILGNLIQHPDKSFHEKGVDVRIAVEMIRFAREDAYDVAFLLSSDTDLVPAVEEVKRFGKQVVYVGTANGQSFGLTKAADTTILLRDSDVKPYFPQTLLDDIG